VLLIKNIILKYFTDIIIDDFIAPDFGITFLDKFDG
jgi:hypothetical protein